MIWLGGCYQTWSNPSKTNLKPIISPFRHLSPPVPSHPSHPSCAQFRGNATFPWRLGRGRQPLHRGRRPTRGRVRCQGMGTEGWSFAGAVLLSRWPNRFHQGEPQWLWMAANPELVDGLSVYLLRIPWNKECLSPYPMIVPVFHRNPNSYQMVISERSTVWGFAGIFKHHCLI